LLTPYGDRGRGTSCSRLGRDVSPYTLADDATTRRGTLARLDQLVGAQDVGARVRLERRPPGLPHPRARREVVDHVAAVHPADEVIAAQIDAVDVEPGMLPNPRQVARRHAGSGEGSVDDGHVVAACEECLHQVGPDEAAPASHQHSPAQRDTLARGARARRQSRIGRAR
jgi:hypothetical protein